MFLVRHAQSEFNVVFNATGRDPGIIDPILTDHGRNQAQTAALKLAGSGITRILASPFTRALETAHILRDRCPADIAIAPLVRERMAYLCDVGRPRSVLARHWPHLDFGGLPEIWWHDHEEAESHDLVADRARQFLDEAAGFEDHASVAVVSHWGFILALTGQAVENAAILELDPADPRGARLIA